MRGRWPALLLALVGLLAGCGLPTGPVEPPDPYPDRSTAAAAWETFLWAWHEGDLRVLSEVTAWTEAQRLEESLQTRGEEGTRAWYRQDAADLTVVEARFTTLGESLAYLRAILRGGAVARVELDFSFVRRPDGWAISDRRLVR